MRRLLLPLALLAGLALSAGTEARAPRLTLVRYDHHVHVHAPAMLDFLPTYCRSSSGGKCDPAFTTPRTVAQLIAAMDSAGIRRASLVSTGYLAQSAFIKPPAPDGATVLRATNDFIVATAREHPDRFMAFIGVNPLTDTALAEIERFSDDPAVAGVKLHLTNSGVDFRDPAHVARLAALFRAAGRHHMAILAHIRTMRPDFGREDADIFLRDVLPAAGGTSVQIAHAAGWGGITPHTLGALGAFADAFERDPRAMRNVSFDLAAVIGDSNEPGTRDQLAALMRRIGMRHFVAGSDYPYALDLRDHYDRVYPQLALSPADWRTLRGNVAPYLAKARRR